MKVVIIIELCTILLKKEQLSHQNNFLSLQNISAALIM